MMIDRMKVSKLTGCIGAQITGVQLAEIDEPTFDEIAEAFWENQVLVFRNQDLSIEEHISLGQRFGELHIHPAIPGVGGHKEILPVFNRGKEKAGTEVWHSAVSSDPRPPSISI